MGVIKHAKELDLLKPLTKTGLWLWLRTGQRFGGNVKANAVIFLVSFTDRVSLCEFRSIKNV